MVLTLGTFFLHAIHRQVSCLRGLRRTYKTSIIKSRATPVLGQRSHSIIAMDVQNLLWFLHFYRSMLITV